MKVAKLTYHRGLSIVELLIPLIIIGISSFKIDSVKKIVSANTHSINVAADLDSAVSIAKIEAKKRRIPISICAAADARQMDCATQHVWNHGWIIFKDTNLDGRLNHPSERIKTSSKLPTGTQIMSTNAFFTYNRFGKLESNSGGLFISVIGCHGQYAHYLSISQNGEAHSIAMSCDEN